MAIDSTELQEGITERIRQVLDEKGESVNWLAQQIDVPQTTLNGQFQRKGFRIETVVPIADALRLNLEWLLTGRGERSRYAGQVQMGEREIPIPQSKRDRVVALLDIIRDELGAGGASNGASTPAAADSAQIARAHKAQETASTARRPSAGSGRSARSAGTRGS